MTMAAWLKCDAARAGAAKPRRVGAARCSDLPGEPPVGRPPQGGPSGAPIGRVPWDPQLSGIISLGPCRKTGYQPYPLEGTVPLS